MKKLFSLFLSLVLLLSIAACGNAPTSPAATQSDTTTAAKQPAPTEVTQPQITTSQEAIEALDGKKILFVGNSYTYYGRVVINQGYDVLTQKERTDNRGLFYYLCQEKGIDVEVTNWVFGGHDLTDTLEGL